MGKKKRPQGKPETMSLAEFTQKAPVNTAIRQASNNADSQWDRLDLNMNKDPAKQAKLNTK